MAAEFVVGAKFSHENIATDDPGLLGEVEGLGSADFADLVLRVHHCEPEAAQVAEGGLVGHGVVVRDQSAVEFVEEDHFLECES